MGAFKTKSASRNYEQEKYMAKLILVSAFVVSLLPAFCVPRSTPEPTTFEPVSAPIYVEPTTTKGKYHR